MAPFLSELCARIAVSLHRRGHHCTVCDSRATTARLQGAGDRQTYILRLKDSSLGHRVRFVGARFLTSNEEWVWCFSWRAKRPALSTAPRRHASFHHTPSILRHRAELGLRTDYPPGHVAGRATMSQCAYRTGSGRPRASLLCAVCSGRDAVPAASMIACFAPAGCPVSSDGP